MHLHAKHCHSPGNYSKKQIKVTVILFKNCEFDTADIKTKTHNIDNSLRKQEWERFVFKMIATVCFDPQYVRLLKLAVLYTLNYVHQHHMLRHNL